MSAESLATLHANRYPERDIICDDCGCTFRSTGQKHYCPEHFKVRRVTAAHKCHAAKNDWDFVFKMIVASCAGPPKEDCVQCPILGCSRRKDDYKMRPKYASRCR